MADKIITPEAILSYPALYTPQAAEEGEDPKYSCALIFPEGTDLTALKKAALAVATEKYGDKAKSMIRSGKLRLPFRTDTEEKGYPDGATFMNVRSKRRPGVVSTVPDPNNDGKPMVITDEEEVYAGCIVKALISPFTYDVKGNKGVGFGLEGVQKIRDGERLDSRVKAEDAFDADPNATADLSDLTGEDEDDLSDLGM